MHALRDGTGHTKETKDDAPERLGGLSLSVNLFVEVCGCKAPGILRDKDVVGFFEKPDLTAIYFPAKVPESRQGTAKRAKGLHEQAEAIKLMDAPGAVQQFLAETAFEGLFAKYSDGALKAKYGGPRDGADESIGCSAAAAPELPGFCEDNDVGCAKTGDGVDHVSRYLFVCRCGCSYDVHVSLCVRRST